MAYSFTSGTHTIVDVPIVAGSLRTENDNEDVGGGDDPILRAGTASRQTFRTVLRAVGSTLGITLSDCMILATSLSKWTINAAGEAAIGPAPVSVNVEGGAVQVAEITIG